jgi:3-phosphoshikimate 1-carboxyvinyltransferase
VLSNFSTSADCNSTLNCLRGLGVAVSRQGNEVVIESIGPSGLKAQEAPLDCGNSGSTMRMLAGVLAGCDFDSVLTGDESLCSRPMKRIIEPLRLMNAEVDSPSGRPPLQIRGSSSLRAISYILPVASAQKSCILLAGLRVNGETEVIEKLGSTRDHTERMLQWFGATVETRDNESDGRLGTTVALKGPAQLLARDIKVPGDISSAAFLIAAAALLPGSDLAIEGVGLNATRTEFLSILQSNGLSLIADDVRHECNEPVGTVRVRGRSAGEHGPPVPPGEVNVVCGGLIPKLIDELPLLAVVGSQIRAG